MCPPKIKYLLGSDYHVKTIFVNGFYKDLQGPGILSRKGRKPSPGEHGGTEGAGEYEWGGETVKSLDLFGNPVSSLTSLAFFRAKPCKNAIFIRKLFRN